VKLAREDMIGLMRLCIAGVGLILLGVGGWLWWEPAGLMLPGAVLICLAVLGEVASLRARPIIVQRQSDDE